MISCNSLYDNAPGGYILFAILLNRNIDLDYYLSIYSKKT